MNLVLQSFSNAFVHGLYIAYKIMQLSKSMALYFFVKLVVKIECPFGGQEYLHTIMCLPITPPKF
jgi:hypothetical protein